MVHSVLFVLLTIALLSPAQAQPVVERRELCPPGFEKTSGNACELRTMYQFYNRTAPCAQ